MADTAIQNAIAKRDKIATEINLLQDKINGLKIEMAHTERFISDWKSFAGEDSDLFQAAESKDTPREKNPSLDIIRKVARAVIEDAGRPLPRRQLRTALRGRSLSIAGKDPLMVLSTMMWRMQDEFVRIAGHGYWFRDRPWPAAGYKPGDIPDTRTKSDDEIQNEVEDL